MLLYILKNRLVLELFNTLIATIRPKTTNKGYRAPDLNRSQWERI